MYINVLYQSTEHDKLFNFLKCAFGESAGQVSVDQIIPETYVTIQWSGLMDANELAQQLTEAVPEVIVECESTTGIDMFSRYFNSNQLW